MIKARLVPFLIGLGLVLGPAPAFAQVGLVQLMLDQFVQNIVLARTPGGGGIAAHTPVFDSTAEVDAVTALVDQVSQQIGAQISNTPLGSSSGGFTYTFDAALGTFKRSAETFGPAFAERALTVGRGKLSFGMNFQHSSYGSLDGRDLQDGDVTFFLPHEKLSPSSFIEGDVIEAAVELRLSSNTTVFFANFGVTDRFDLGVAVPIQNVHMDLTYHATILDFATAGVSPPPHRFENGQKTDDFNVDQSATGIGDVVVRAKFALPSRGANAFAMGLDLRLPTGDEANMLGTGATQAQIYLIASSTRGKFSPHLNAGVTLAGGGDNASHQINYVGGVEYMASPKVTIVGDLLGRTFTSVNRLVDAPQQHQFQAGSNAAPVQTTTLEAIGVEEGSATSFLAAVGLKANPTGKLVVSAHLLFSLNSAGLRRGVTPVIGFDFSY